MYDRGGTPHCMRVGKRSWKEDKINDGEQGDVVKVQEDEKERECG